jgi:hypothetical protein
VQHRPAFGSVPAGTNPAQGRATGGGFVPDDDADEDAQPEYRVTLPADAYTIEVIEWDVPITLADQLEALGAHVFDAHLETDVPQTIGLALSRIASGYHEHGTALFRMSDADLERNLREEYADALVYRAEQLRREALREDVA